MSVDVNPIVARSLGLAGDGVKLMAVGDYREASRALRQAANQLDEAESRGGEWCPVCHTYHVSPGEKTDAGRLTRPCRLLSAKDPRNQFANYPGGR